MNRLKQIFEDEFSTVSSKVSPYMGGIGISSAIVSFNVALYYNTIIAWCLFYFVQVNDLRSDQFRLMCRAVSLIEI